MDDKRIARDLPNPQIRYVVVPSAVATEAEVKAVRERIRGIIGSFGKVSLRFEVRYWDPEKQNNTTWRGTTINAHFDDLAMAEAVVEKVRRLLVEGQRVEGERSMTK